METNLHFIVTKIDGSQVTQDIQCPTEAVEAAMNQVMAQYSQVGLLKKEGTDYMLLPASQIALVECKIPSIVIASPNETEKVAAAADGVKATLKRIK